MDRAKLLEMSHIQKSSFLKLANTFKRCAEEISPNPKGSSCGVEQDKYMAASLLKKIKTVTKGKEYCCSHMTSRPVIE